MVVSKDLLYSACCWIQNNDTGRSHTKKMEVVSSAVGSGLHRKLILGSGVRIDKSRYDDILYFIESL